MLPHQQHGAAAAAAHHALPQSAQVPHQAPPANAAASAVPQAVPDDLSVLLVTAGYDHTIRFWEAWSGICSRTIQHPDSQINRLAISPDKRWLASCGVGVVRLYDCRSALGAGTAGGTAGMGASGPGGGPSGAGGGVGGHAGQGAAGGAGGQHGGGGGGGHNAHHGHHGGAGPGGAQPVATFEGHAGNVTCVAWHCEGKWLVTGGEDGMLRIWDTRSPRPQRVYDHRSPVNDVVVHPNQGELVSCDQGGSIKIWDLGENGCSHELVPEEDVAIRSVSVASDGSCLVAGNNNGNVYVWRIQSGVYPTQSETADIGRSAGAPLGGGGAGRSARGKAKAGSKSKKSASQSRGRSSPPLLDENGDPIRASGAGDDEGDDDDDDEHDDEDADEDAEEGEDEAAAQAAGAANGAGPSGDFTDLQPVTKFRAHDKYLIRCILSPDVRHLATTSADTTVKIWSTSRYDFSLEKTLVGHQRWVWDAAFSADSAYLVTASSDHVARLWELASGETVRQYNGHNKAVVCCALNDSAGG